MTVLLGADGPVKGCEDGQLATPARPATPQSAAAQHLPTRPRSACAGVTPGDTRHVADGEHRRGGEGGGTSA